jgi:putative PIN family toxin of toxin-antitoxin system
MRVFLDTNVLASAAATRGLCADVLRAVFAFHELIISDYVIEELKLVLGNKFGVPHNIIAEYIWLLHQDSVVIREADPPAVRLKDESDISILGAAIEAKADVLVTGDLELQGLGQIGGLHILSPRGFWEKLRAHHDGPADG